jgi:hypothetical protein
MQPSASEDDLDLIRRVVRRDRQAFETLYQRYSPVVYLLVKCPPAKALGGAHDVMMVVWKPRAGGTRDSQPDTGYCSQQGAQGSTRSARFDAEVERRSPTSRAHWP